jgi:Cu2+-containing amine oxidase
MDPLDPLTEGEIRVAAAVCKKLGEDGGLPELRFNTITLKVSGLVVISF